ncbi:hypothetical protein NCS52_00023000 [Fusarium sp. LHS14.1]|nr:hypothetical protein NCS52_00023000 [Fusarium sp. LHS14.1]
MRGQRPTGTDGEAKPESRSSVVCISCCILNTLLGGSLNVYSLYGPRFIRDLHLDQYHVNTISTMAMMPLYIFIPVWGRICQLTSPRLLSFIAGILFGTSYLTIASMFTTHHTSTLDHSRPAFLTLLLAYTSIGAATSSVLMSSIIACTETLEKSHYKGFLSAVPIACFGLSGILESQVAVRLFCLPKKDIDLVSFSAFLAIALFSTGMLGAWGLKPPKEVLDIRGHLQNSEERQTASYGAVEPQQLEGNMPAPDRSTCSLTALLKDPLIWWLSVANLLIVGPTEVYNLNLGTLLQSITGTESVANQISHHVALLAIVSTVARLSAGALSDCLQREGNSTTEERKYNLVLSPFVLFLAPATVDVLGFLTLGTLVARFPKVISMTSASVGLSYASSLSLLPVTLSIWGTAQFPLAWGIISLAPALGIGAFGYLYSVAYQYGLERGGEVAGFCVGALCYTSWAIICALGVGASIVCVLMAWLNLSNRRHRYLSWAVVGVFYDGIGQELRGIVAAISPTMVSNQLLQTVSFTCSILNSLIAGCMSTIPIYGPRLILDIGYTQAQLNAVITVAMLSAYLMSPVGGYLCRKLSPRVLSLICGGLLSGGYVLTASVFFVSHRPNVEAVGSSFWKVLLAHFMIGSGTSSIQLSALDACARNLLQSRYKGMLMSIPATAVGMGGIALSQMASHLFMTNQDPGSAPYLDAGRLLVLLSSLAMAVGLISALGLVVVQKEVVMPPVVITQVEDSSQAGHLIPKHQPLVTYGTIDEGDASTSVSSGASSSEQQVCKEGENHLFRDQALWWFMGGMALLPGTIAVYLNNLGTITAAMSDDSTDQGSRLVQQITILSTVATVARLTLGVISDRAASAPELPLGQTPVYRTRFIVLIVPAILVSIGYLLLATPLAGPQYSNIALHLCSALLGLGYGCNSAAMPAVAQAWGPESFSVICSWISLSPAPAIAVWGWLYSFLYEWVLDTTRSSQCHEWSCYGIWALASSATAICAAFAWAMSCAQLRSRGINV